MEVPQVRFEAFVRDVSLVPTVDDLLRATEPEQLERVYREAGLQSLAENVEPLRRAMASQQGYVELSAADFATYADFLSESVALGDCTIPPPDEVLTVLLTAQKARFFDAIFIQMHPESGESLLLGSIQVADSVRYFKIAQWGHSLTSIEKLRTPPRRPSVWSRAAKRRPHLSLARLFRASRGGPVFFGAITLLVTLPCWLLLPTSWWLFAGALAVTSGFSGWYVAENTGWGSSRRVVVGWIIAIEAAAAITMGGFRLHSWATTDRTEEVLVCGKHKGDDEWVIETSKGNRNLEKGFYNGTLYPTGSDAAAKQLVGNWVRLTLHGHNTGSEDSGPYVTRAETLHAGSCG